MIGSKVTMSSLEEIAKSLEQSDDYRVLRKLKPFERIHIDDAVEKKKGVVVDVETTGFDSKNDRIIELGLIVFEFSSDGRIFDIIDVFSCYEDPLISIPPAISELTGIHDDDVKGKKIDDQKVADLLNDVVLVIAHNAGFDRPFLETRFPLFSELPWACSQTQIPWSEEGVTGKKLEYLAQVFGFFYGAHRALDDVWAVLKILSLDLPKSGILIMGKLLESAREPSYIVSANHAPFDKKDLLKGRRYRWNGSSKVWEIMLSEKDLDEEIKFLKEFIYENDNAVVSKKRITARTRFSKRV
jgi:DNA polymerase-3 subunit epsilon